MGVKAFGMKRSRFLVVLFACLLMCSSLIVSVLCVSFASEDEADTSTSKLFGAETGVSVLGFSTLPSYFEGTEYRGTKDGALVQFTKNNAVFSYSSVIDLNTLGDRSFIELQMIPKNRMQKEAGAVYVQLTDIFNEENYITIKLQSADVHTYSQYVYVAASADGLYEPQGHLMNSESYNEYGSTSASTFYGVRDGFSPASIELFYDNAAKSIYVNPSEWGTKYCVINFADPLLGGKFEAFEGLQSGKVKLSIYMDGISGTDANVLIQSVGGKTVSTLKDESAGKINFAVNNGGATEMNDAVAGGVYPVPNAVAYNNKHIFAAPIAKVYYEDERVSVSVKDGVFETEQAGKYYLEYETYNNSMIVKSEPIVINAKAGYDDPLAFLTEPEIADSAYAGEKVILPNGEAKGGIGILSVNKKVTVGGTEVEILRDGTVEYFVPVQAGSYKIEYTIEDERGGVSDVYEYTLQVDYSEIPLVLESRIPSSLLKGLPFAFPKMGTVYVGADGALEVKTEILINGVDYADKEYVPESDFTVTYKISSAANPEKAYSWDYQVKVVDAANANGMYIADPSLYFEKENATLEYKTTGMRFTSENAGATNVTFVKQILADEFSIEILPDGVNALNIVFYDASDVSKSLQLTFGRTEASKGYSKLLVNGEYVGQISGNYGDATISLYYNDKTCTFTDASGKVILKPDRWSDGTEFTGFSDYIYVEAGMNGAQGAWYEVRSLSGQTFSSDGTGTNVRIAAPSIVYSDSLAGAVRKTLNESFTVPGAKAFDVFGAVTGFNLTITSPGGKVLYNDTASRDSFDIQLTEKGSYTIVFTATNNFNRKSTGRYIVSVYDTTPPAMELNGKYAESIRVGKSLEILSATAKDNAGNDITVYIYVTEPNGYSCQLKAGEKYTFSRAGKYVIKYFTFDSEMNYVLNEYTVICK